MARNRNRHDHNESMADTGTDQDMTADEIAAQNAAVESAHSEAIEAPVAADAPESDTGLPSEPMAADDAADDAIPDDDMVYIVVGVSPMPRALAEPLLPALVRRNAQPCMLVRASDGQPVASVTAKVRAAAGQPRTARADALGSDGKWDISQQTISGGNKHILKLREQLFDAIDHNDMSFIDYVLGLKSASTYYNIAKRVAAFHKPLVEARIAEREAAMDAEFGRVLSEAA